MKPKVLIVEDERMFAEAVAYVLDRAGFEALTAHESRLALEQAREFRPDLCILSSALLPVSASLLCCELRHAAGPEWNPPILMLGTDEREETRVQMLNCGVDDYLAKPFGMKEFMARVFALLRRAKVPLEALTSEEISAGRFCLNAVTKSLVIRDTEGERVVSLTPKESQILHALFQSRGFTVSREFLIERVWGKTEATPGLFNTLDVHMRALRLKVEKDPSSPEHLYVVRGVGFRFEV